MECIFFAHDNDRGSGLNVAKWDLNCIHSTASHTNDVIFDCLNKREKERLSAIIKWDDFS